MNRIYASAVAILFLSIVDSGFAQLNSVWSYDFPPSQVDTANSLARDEFPKNFKFGVSISSYQNEGAWNVSDKGLSVWDYALNTYPNITIDGSNGNVATDFYHKYKEDIQLAKSIGTNIFRISINWPRLLPTGFTNHISEDGARFYNNVINELLANGITPVVTLFHGETPYTIHRLGSFLNPLIIDLLTDYARVAFTLFGDRVKFWISINEIEAMCLQQNKLPDPVGYNLSGIMEYECFRNSLLAHASVYHMYKRDYAISQKGKIGFTLESLSPEPTTDSENGTQAAYSAIQWFIYEILNIIFSKERNFSSLLKDRINYLSYLQGYAKSRAQPFTNTEIRLLKRSADFLGVNFYRGKTLPYEFSSATIQQQYLTDVDIGNVYLETFQDSQSSNTPWTLRSFLNYLKKNYDIPEIYITEAGYRSDASIRDVERAFQFHDYLKTVLDLLKDGFDIKGFLLWTLTDNFAWRFGYQMITGIFSVDFNNVTLPRTPKLSSKIVGNIFKDKRIKPILEMLTEKEDITAMQEYISSLNLS